MSLAGHSACRHREDDQTVAFRGSKSRNKVSVGEPAEGSFSITSLSEASCSDKNSLFSLGIFFYSAYFFPGVRKQLDENKKIAS